MELFICKYCEKEHHIKYGKGIFCSKKCACAYAGMVGDKEKKRQAAYNSEGARKGLLKIIELSKKRSEELKNKWSEISHCCENCGIENDGMYGSGRFCSQKCSRSFSTKNNRDEINKKRSLKLIGTKRPKEFGERIKKYNLERGEDVKNKISESMKIHISNNPHHLIKMIEGSRKRVVTDDERKGLSERAKKTGLGGHTSKNKLYYESKNGKIIYLHSSYEIMVAKSLDENNINWVRPDFIVWVDEKNITHKYYADFYLIYFDVYLDTKNDYLIKKDEVKIKSASEQNKVNILVINKNQLDWNIIKELL